MKEYLAIGVSGVALWASSAIGDAGAPTWVPQFTAILAGTGVAVYLRIHSGKYQFSEIAASIPISFVSGWYFGRGLAYAVSANPQQTQWTYFFMALVGAFIVRAAFDLFDSSASDMIGGILGRLIGKERKK